MNDCLMDMTLLSCCFSKRKEICYTQFNLFQMQTIRLIDGSETIIIQTSQTSDFFFFFLMSGCNEYPVSTT